MTEREKELTDALKLLVQKAEWLSNNISELEWAETDHVSNHAAPIGSEPWFRTLGAIREARAGIKANRLILDAALREAKDTLYTEAPKLVQEDAA